MPTIDRIDGYADELTAIRRDLHAHPEIGFEEVRTSGNCRRQADAMGPSRCIAVLAAPVWSACSRAKAPAASASVCAPTWMRCRWKENTNLKWRSTIPGKFHGCGHDGHTTMLLGTARYLAETKNFDGTVHFIFQPAEEGLGGSARHDQGRAVREISLRRGLWPA